jgi:predicted MPP superfamily phosphohydrolase
MKTALKWIGTILAAIILVLIFWGAAIEPRFILETTEHDAQVQNLPSEWEGQKIALIADFQIGMWLDNPGMVEGAVASAILERPAAVLIAGDFVYKPDRETVRTAVNLVRPLAEEGIPTFAVLGNHDYSLMKRDSEKNTEIAEYLRSELEAAGITVLENSAEALRLRDGGAPLYIAGIGSEWAENSAPGAALAGVPDGEPRVVFMHNPVVFRDLPADSAPLALAGHTHGGQIRIPFTPSESWLDIARDREVVADGWAVDSIGAPGNRLYVNRGIGFSSVPIRINCEPELSLFTLRPAS